MVNLSLILRRWTACFLLSSAFVIVFLTGHAGGVPQTEDPGIKEIPGSFRDTNLVALTRRFYRLSDDLPTPALLGVKKIIAYEENRPFVYIRGSGPFGDRRVIFCRPATFIIYDIPLSLDHPWRLVCTNTPKITENGFSISEGNTVLTGQNLLPDCLVKPARADGAHLVETVQKNAADITRFIHVINIHKKDADVPKTTFTEKDGIAGIKVIIKNRTFTITLPTDPKKPGTIAVSRDGKIVLPKRPLPAGILPHGRTGVQMLKRWDSDYRGNRIPGWEIGRPAKELIKAVENGTIRPGSALVLGCGSGTNAVYLAAKGFDVTGVDVAPTALVIAEQKAKEANVSVQWLLADVLALPEIGKFDFIFDRGCYHWVRQSDAPGFAKMTRQVSHDKTYFLLLTRHKSC